MWLYVLRNKNMGADDGKTKLSSRAVLFISVLASFVIGMYDGFTGREPEPFTCWY